MEILYLIIPAYNEEDNIAKVLEEWYPIIEKYHGDGRSRMVVIDDGSSDSTFEIVNTYSKTHPYLEAVRKENSGHGATVLFGYQLAITRGADYIFQTDSDGQTVASEFHEFWEQRKAYDMVIGNRNHREDGIARIFVTKVLRLVIKLTFGVRVQDANTPFRLMKVEALRECITVIPKDFPLTNVIVSTVMTKKHRRIKYIPITFRQRQGGTNSINIKKIIGIGVRTLGDFHEINTKISL